MKLYLLSQDRVCGWDTYDSVVVAAKSEDDAREIHPYGDDLNGCPKWREDWPRYEERECINVEYLGETERARGVVCASFNAG